MKVHESSLALTVSTLSIALGFHIVNASSTTNSDLCDENYDTISWGSCAEGISPSLECATFQVPLDWADKSKGNISLAVIRLPHDSSQPREGYMFYNPGGPGGSGIQFLSSMGPALQAQIGRSWDLVSWDPRGAASSEPHLILFDDDPNLAKFWSATRGLGHLEAHGNLTARSDIDFFMSQAPVFDDLLQSYNEKHIEKHGDLLKYVGSAATVRDLVALTEAIYGQGADINFYGYSYGTVLGAYLTQMFPDRVGKVIVDGVLDPFLYANAAPIESIPLFFEDSEKGLQGFASYCVAAPDKCALAQAIASEPNHTGNVTVSDIIGYFDQIFSTAYQIYDGSSFQNPDGSTTITGLTFVGFSELIHAYLHLTSTWQTLDRGSIEMREAQLNATSGIRGSGNGTSTLSKLRHRNSLSGPAAGLMGAPDPMTVIACGDVIDPGSFNTTTEDIFRLMVDQTKTTSPHFSSILHFQSPCHRWTSRAVERLAVPFNTKPKNVVLVIGNTADPATPYSSAKRLASEQQLGSMARLVKLNAIGHTTASNNSTCIDNLIHSYVRGIIPADAGNDEADVECEIEGNPFDSF